VTAVLVVCGWVGASAARAAELRTQAESPCADAVAQIGEQVGVLLGRPLASVPDADFSVEIAPAPGNSWRLRLDLVDRRAGAAGGAPRSRELTAASCAELADAAAVAIAMSVRALDAGEPPATPARPPAPMPPAATAPPADATVRTTAASSAPERITPVLTLATVAGIGALPGPGLGLQLDVGAQISFIRLVARGALFASQEKRLADDTGGDFLLAFGALLACASQAVGKPTLLGCAGFELGRLSGEGLGIDRPRLGTVTWLAPTAEVGIHFPLTPKLAVVVRAGAAVPLQRPDFVIDPTVRIHRPASIDGRAALGLEWAF